MATARETALQSLRDMWYSQGQIDSAMAQVRGQQAKGQTASQIKSNVQSNSSSYFWGSAMYGSWGSSSSSNAWGSWLTNKDTSSNTNAEDIYWDVSWGNKGAWPMDFSGSNWKIDETSLKFWTNAHAEQAKNKNYLTTRNNDIAAYLYGIGSTDSAKVREYLNKFNDFTSAPQEDQDNTVRAISDRLSAIVKEKDTTWMKDMADALNGNKLDSSIIWKDWYYIDGNGKYQKIYGYDEMDDETKGLLDRMDDKQKKYVSNLWAQGMQDDIKYYLDTMRTKDQAAARQKNSQELYDINRESSIIQAEQTLRNAEESYNNLKQNWQYLGNMWMPGTSATKIQAIGDAISEAKTQLGEVKRLTQLSLDAQQKNWDWQVLQYNQQIDNLMYDLKWKVWDEITWALSKYTTAELEWKLDTIDGITAFRKELLDDLDKNLSWLTSASLTQMQWINQQYQDIANKMYEYSQNANVVNPEMSSIKWFYVDGNGNPILNDKWEIIQVPPTAPLEPVFDKETWKLITFATDENWNIVASVQQLWNSNTESPQGTIAQLLQEWYTVADIMANVPWADADTISKVAKAMWVEIAWWVAKWLWGTDEGWTTLWSEWSWNQVKLGEKAVDTGIPNVYWSNVKLAPTVWAMLKSAYDSLKEQGIDLQIWDSYRSFETQMKAYKEDQAKPANQRKGVAAPWKSFHEIWQAIDVAQSQMNDPKVIEALYAAWFTRPVASEPRHWSYWEGKDAFWYATKKQDKSYDPSLSRYYENWFKLTKDDRANALKEYWLTLEQFNKQMNNYFDSIEKTEAVESITALRNKAQELLDWNKKNPWLHEGKYDLQTFKNWSYSALGWLIQWQTKASEWAQMYNWLKNNQTLDKFIEAKKNGWTFGAMSEWEWKILWDAASELTWETNDTKFQETLEKMINTYDEKLAKITWKTIEEVKGSKWWGTKRTKVWGWNLE